MLTLPVAGAQSTEDWPDAIDYPPNPAYQPFPAVTEPQRAESSQPTAAATGKEGKPEKKSFWPFGRKKKNKGPAPTTEQIVNVGPRELPARPDPLLRLPVKLQVPEGVIPAGIYMVRQTAVHGDSRELTLTQRNQAVAIITVRAMGSAETDSPITQNPRQPVPVSLMAQASPDGKSITIILKEGERRYASDPLPALLDTRPVISY